MVEITRKEKKLSCFSTHAYHHTWSNRAAPASPVTDTSVSAQFLLCLKMQWGSHDLPGLNITPQSSDKQRLKKNRKKAELKKMLLSIFTNSRSNAETMHRGDSEEQGKGSSSKVAWEETVGDPPTLLSTHTHNRDRLEQPFSLHRPVQ